MNSSDNLYGSSKISMEYKIDEIRLNQNIGMGILGGAIGAVIGAILWAMVTAVIEYQIGWMAIGVGFLVGKCVSYFGKGIDSYFRVIGATFSLVGCILGNLLTVLIVISNQEGIAFLELLKLLDLQISIEILIDTFSPMDLLFYAFALYEGYKFSVKNINQEIAKEAIVSENIQ